MWFSVLRGAGLAAGLLIHIILFSIAPSGALGEELNLRGSRVELLLSLTHGQSASIDLRGKDFFAKLECKIAEDKSWDLGGWDLRNEEVQDGSIIYMVDRRYHYLSDFGGWVPEKGNFVRNVKKPRVPTYLEVRFKARENAFNQAILRARDEGDLRKLHQEKRSLDRFIDAKVKLQKNGGEVDFEEFFKRKVKIKARYDAEAETYLKWHIVEEAHGEWTTTSYVDGLALIGPLPGKFRDDLEFSYFIAPNKRSVLGFNTSNEPVEPFIEGVILGTPASQAGMVPGMKILEINERPATKELLANVGNVGPNNEFLVLHGDEKKRLVLGAPIEVRARQLLYTVRKN